jgi:hypothetical protein
VAIKKHCGTADPDYEVDFREAITDTIPSFVRPLEDKASAVRRETVKLIANLATHGEWQLDVIAHC